MNETTVTNEVKISKKELLRTANERIAVLEKENNLNKTNYDNWYKRFNEVQREIEAIQEVIDFLPNAPSRKKEGSYSDTPVLTRLCAWLATRS